MPDVFCSQRRNCASSERTTPTRSTLTKGETYFFLREGLTVEGKPFKDFWDARNHAEAIDYLYAIIKDERPLTPGLMKEFNKLIMSGVTHTEAMEATGQKVQKPATPGEYKRLPNHVLQADGTIHRHTEPLHVPSEMEELFKWIEESLAIKHAVVVSAIAHYNFVRIHPFEDGNGRGARLLMNLLLIKKALRSGHHSERATARLLGGFEQVGRRKFRTLHGVGGAQLVKHATNHFAGS